MQAQTSSPCSHRVPQSSQARQQDALQTLAQQALSQGKITELFEAAAEIVTVALNVPHCRCWQMLSDNLTLQHITATTSLLPLADSTDAAAGFLSLSNTQINIQIAPWREQILTVDHPLSFNPHTTAFLPLPQSFSTRDIGEGVVVPIRGLDQELMALIELYAAPKQCFNPEELSFLHSVAHLLATAIQRSRSEALLKTQSLVLEQLAAGASVHEVFCSLCLLMEEHSPGGLCSILLLDESGTKIRPGAAPNFPAEWSIALDGLRIGEGVASCGTALHRKQSVFVEDIGTDPLWDSFRDFAFEHGIHSCWSTPFFAQDGKVLGTFALSHRTACAPLKYHHQLIKTATHLASIATESSRSAAQLRHQAHHDVLTKLYNRTVLLERIQRKLQQPQAEPFAVVFLDVDHFKLVNDSWGHRVGDQLLVAIARRLEHHLGPKDIFARLSGDEFAILLDRCISPEQTQALVSYLVEEFTPAFEVGSCQLFASASFGIAYGGDGFCQTSQNCDQQPEDLLRNADIAMCWAKHHRGGEKMAVFDQAMHERVLARHRLENGLHQAVQSIGTMEKNAGIRKKPELSRAHTGRGSSQAPWELYYQPIVQLTTQTIIGFEALLRWHHPEWGMVSPTEFIPIAEETGLIIPLGSWVMEQACVQIHQWHQQLGNTMLGMSINVSAQQLFSSHFVTQVEQTLTQMQLPPASIKLEITESVLIEAAGVVKDRLKALRALGVQLCLDDFGTGYSSLSYLHQFPVNTLKIDRSFVMNLGPDNDQLTRAIVFMGQGLGMNTIAEGIETDAQAAQLLTMGCKYGQGYLFSPPVDRLGAEALLGLR